MCGEVYEGSFDPKNLMPVNTAERVRKSIGDILSYIKKTSEAIEVGKAQLAETKKEMEAIKDDPDWQEELALMATEIRSAIKECRRIRKEFNEQVLELSSLLEVLESNN